MVIMSTEEADSGNMEDNVQQKQKMIIGRRDKGEIEIRSLDELKEDDIVPSYEFGKMLYVARHEDESHVFYLRDNEQTEPALKRKAFPKGTLSIGSNGL